MYFITNLLSRLVVRYVMVATWYSCYHMCYNCSHICHGYYHVCQAWGLGHLSCMAAHENFKIIVILILNF